MYWTINGLLHVGQRPHVPLFPVRGCVSRECRWTPFVLFYLQTKMENCWREEHILSLILLNSLMPVNITAIIRTWINMHTLGVVV